MSSLDFQIIPVTEAAAQHISITLRGQACEINLYTKSVNVPVQEPGTTASDPNPTYENANPVFLDLAVNGALVVGGVMCLNDVRIVRNSYLGFVGDLTIIDTTGSEDPQGAPLRLPPPNLRNVFQRNLPLSLAGKMLVAQANKIPGLGTRWLLTYWPNL